MFYLSKHKANLPSELNQDKDKDTKAIENHDETNANTNLVTSEVIEKKDKYKKNKYVNNTFKNNKEKVPDTSKKDKCDLCKFHFDTNCNNIVSNVKTRSKDSCDKNAELKVVNMNNSISPLQIKVSNLLKLYVYIKFYYCFILLKLLCSVLTLTVILASMLVVR